ncbi:hypothetical protein X777_01322 [Ooceraea biroi]|uniref:Uncharacterized protein n=1 Tax=Ooceraea biroi TaxID=2015173 RepID=A0A026WQQ9_OOCBI|nr:hypothetical protein X777_01322 [Ooceraea biroi]
MVLWNGSCAFAIRFPLILERAANFRREFTSGVPYHGDIQFDRTYDPQVDKSAAEGDDRD